MNDRSFIFAAQMRIRDEQKEKTIKAKAVEMIVKDGLDGMSMQKLAKAASCSPATIYIYFKDRDDLILKLAVEAFNEMAEETLRDFDPQMHFAEGLKIQWINRARYCMKNSIKMDFMEQIRHSRYQDKAFRLLDRHFFDTMGTFVHTAVNRKELIPLPVEIYWAVAFAPLYQLVKFHIQGRGLGGFDPKFVFTEEMMMQTLNLVIKALTP